MDTGRDTDPLAQVRALGAERAALRAASAAASTRLRAAVVEAMRATPGLTEVELARVAQVDRGVVRGWLGKQRVQRV